MKHEQIDLFAASYEAPSFPSHIRLIEFFAGMGCQAKGLDIIHADYEHWRTCEWSWQSIIAYNAIHIKTTEDYSKPFSYDEILNAIRGVSHDYNQPMTEKQLRAKGEEWARKVYNAMIGNNNFCPDISKLHAKDLDIEDKENNTYILTYSFPCTDLSLAGRQEGMEKGSGTRSGLLWEVERILNECKELDALPQVLIMENVPQVCGKGNLKPWGEWLLALEEMGYTNYFKILNSKDYGIPQNRKRCFMVSILGQKSYLFPKKTKLRYVLKDFIEKKVDEYYYLSDKLVAGFVRHTEKHATKGNGFAFKPQDGSQVSGSIVCEQGNHPTDTFIDETPISSKESEDLSTPLGKDYSQPTLYIPAATKKGYMEAHEGDGVLPSWKGARGTVQEGGVSTILTSPETIGVVVKDERDQTDAETEK